MTFRKIALTGGPGAGKSEALEFLRDRFEKRGYRVILLRETATEMILAGLIPSKTIPVFSFQSRLFELQLFREQLYEHAAMNMDDENILLICDRGIMDGQVFLQKGEFEEIMRLHNTNKPFLLDRYDAIFHLQTAAALGQNYYSLENNQARSEDWKTALQQDEALYDSWADHPFHFVVEAKINMADKLEVLDQTILNYLESVK